MTQTQFLISLIAIIPLLNFVTAKICDESKKLLDFFTKIFPVLHLVNLIGIYGNLNRDNSYLTLIESVRGGSLAFDIDEISLKFLFGLNFIWIVFAFYSRRFFFLREVREGENLQRFLILIFAFLNLIILAKNLLTILFFYNCLIILSHFFSLRFLHKSETKFSKFFTFLLYLESILFFFAIVATYKFAGQIDFADGGILVNSLNSWQFGLLLFVYLGGLFLSIILPSYLFYRSINLEPITLYALFFLSYAFAGIYILIKILTLIFGLDAIPATLGKSYFLLIEIIFLANIAISSMLLIFAKGLKSSFFYLLFQQFLLAIFATLFWAFFDPQKLQISALSFALNITLFFFGISNIALYLHKSENKELRGIFYKLKISGFFLIIALLNMSGFFVGIGGLEKFFLLKLVLVEKLPISAAIYFLNFVAISIFFVKMILPFFKKDLVKMPAEIKSKYAKLIPMPKEQKIIDEIAENIDYDSALVLGAFLIVIAIILSAILYPFFSQNFF